MKALAAPFLLLAGLVCLADDKPAAKPADPPAPKLPLGRDTTYVVGPFDKLGYIDYEAALNAEFSKGITPEKNANALLILALGPAPEGGEGLPPAYFKWLDVPAPPKEGDYFVGLTTFGRELGLTQEQMEGVYEVQSRASQRVWVAKDCPPLIEWLKANEKPLAVAIEAVKRPSYYSPLASRRKEGDPSNLIGTLIPSVQKCRELASALSIRATLKIGEGKFDDAWRDILACHRLGRHVTHGATIIESLVGIAICQIAANATLVYLDRADLSSKQALDRLKDLQGLSAVKPLADKIDIGERMMGLDALQGIRRGGGATGLGNILGEQRELTKDELKALEMIDWTSVMQRMNKWYDQMASAMRVKDRAEREKAFDKIEADLNAATKVFKEPADLKKALDAKDPGKAIGKGLGDVLMGLLTPAVHKVQQAHDRCTQVERNLHVAFALAAYRKDTGRYPAKLADLAPKYLAAVPDDVFVGKPLIYKLEEKG